MPESDKPYCHVCKKDMNSLDQYLLHIGGAEHSKALQVALEMEKNAKNAADSTTDKPKKGILKQSSKKEETVQPQYSAESVACFLDSLKEQASDESWVEFDKSADVSSTFTSTLPVSFASKKNVMCEVCDVLLTSDTQEAAHYAGRKHRNAVAKKNGEPPVGKSTGKASKLSGLKVTSVDPFEKEVIMFASLKEFQVGVHLGVEEYYDRLRYGDEDVWGAKESKISREDQWLREKDVLCSVCMVHITSTLLAQDHFNGGPHKKKCQAAEKMANSDMDWCQVCAVPLTSKVIRESHFSGEKHKQKLKLVKELESAQPGVSALAHQGVAAYASKRFGNTVESPWGDPGFGVPEQRFGTKRPGPPPPFPWGDDNNGDFGDGLPPPPRIFRAAGPVQGKPWRGGDDDLGPMPKKPHMADQLLMRQRMAMQRAANELNRDEEEDLPPPRGMPPARGPPAPRGPPPPPRFPRGEFLPPPPVPPPGQRRMPPKEGLGFGRGRDPFYQDQDDGYDNMGPQGYPGMGRKFPELGPHFSSMRQELVRYPDPKSYIF